MASRPDGDIHEISRSDSSRLVWASWEVGLSVSLNLDKEWKILDRDAFEQYWGKMS